MIMLIFIWVSVLACAYTKTFTPSEHAGVWQADYTGMRCVDIQLTGVETLTLRADGTYQQIYDDGKGYVYRSSWNKWYLNSEGRILHLKNGRIYSLGIREAEKRARARGALCSYIPESIFEKDITIECTDAILYVIPEPDAEGGLVLQYPACHPDDIKRVEFYLAATPVPTATIAP